MCFKIGPVHDKTTIPTQNVVNYAPTRENQLKLHTLNNVGQAMIIRLALDNSSQSGNYFTVIVNDCLSQC